MGGALRLQIGDKMVCCTLSEGRKRIDWPSILLPTQEYENLASATTAEFHSTSLARRRPLYNAQAIGHRD